MKAFLSLVLAAFYLGLFAQSLTGVVIDNSTNQSIGKVLVKNKSSHSTTDKEGVFVLERDKSNVSFSHLAYEPLSLRNDHIDRLDSVFLTPRKYKLEEVQINSTRKIAIIPTPDKFQAKSMGQIGENLMVFFAKKYRGKTSQVNLYDLAANKISTIDVDFNIDEMIKTCDNQYYLVDKHFAYLVGIVDLKLTIVNKIPYTELKQVYDQCIFSHGDKYVFEHLKLNKLIANYQLVDDREAKHLHEILDPALVAQYYKEYNFIHGEEINPEEAAAIMQDIDSHRSGHIRDLQEQRDFFTNVIFKKHRDNYSAYREDHWLLFNCQQDSLHVYNKEGSLVENLGIQYPDKVYDIICDYQKKDVYALTKNGPYQHVVWHLSNQNQFEKILTIKADRIFDVFIDQGQIYYLKAASKGNFLERSFCFESL